MKAIGAALLEEFLRLAGNTLAGDWVLLGATVLPLLGAKNRITLDIDLVGPPTSTLQDTLKLMEIAEKLGILPEAINQAGGLFLHRIPDWKDHLVEIYRGKRAIIYRPDKTLYLMLKIGRMTESDLSDCLGYLKYAKDPQPIQVAKLRKFAERQMNKKDVSVDCRDRIGLLLEHLQKS
jgi:hypothetical protein